ncbi:MULTISPECIES: SAV_915 family protein [Aeromicrobium]|uniref:SAV_915 family protein n=1 Tax=Aeromicrobium TaxID=2040 RepID=UPI0006F88DD0|nr:MULTISPECIES: SAV_915 family protein [Aeromicrobium]KQX75883.1 hypothetical protein ASD10_12290 [Aeromicrobium sp. Root472D3]MBD8606440.1 hypothetical protein [Aeromicrobium sp. CFBP 8757]MCL8250519.1 hypothetical protein [Aeromicrobium fastidiosum]
MSTLVVPVRHSPFGTLTPMTARLRNGTRVGIAYTSIAALEAVQPNRQWIRLSEAALNALLSPLGIRTVQVDPQLLVADLCSTAPDRPICA